MTKQKQIIVEHYIRKSEEAAMLSIYEKAVIQMLASFMGSNDKCWPDLKELARVCSCSERTVKRALKKLKDKQIINIERRKYFNIYNFNKFWLDEAHKFLTPALAAEAYINSNQEGTNGPQEVSVSPQEVSERPPNNIKNNIKNNYTEWKGKTVDTAEEPSPLLIDYLKLNS